MAGRPLIVTGDKKLTRQLNSLAKNVAAKFNRTAVRKAAKLVLDEAKNKVPVMTGAFRRSLTVRAMPRKKKSMGYRVTQKEVNRAGTDKDKAFYGGFLELGYYATGRPRKHGRYAKNTIDAYAAKPDSKFYDKSEQTRAKKINTYRGTRFSIRQLRSAKRVKGRWILRQAGNDKEEAAHELYVSELRRLVDEG